MMEIEAVDGPVDPFEDDARLEQYFAGAWPVVRAFAELLRAHGAERGLLGPNEAARIWDRHLLNCAAGVALLPTAGTLLDLGSGAGLPGVVLSAMRPDAHVVLLEAMERRADWLHLVVSELALTNTEVIHGRAEDVAGELVVDAVTARAVSSLENLFRWSAPLVRIGGGFYAIKGARAADEVSAARRAARRHGWSGLRVEEVSSLVGVEATHVVVAERVVGPSSVR